MMDVGCGLADPTGAPADDWTVTGTPAGSPRSLSVRVPENARAGDTMRIYHGVTGEVFSCAVPPGGEGQTLLVPICDGAFIRSTLPRRPCSPGTKIPKTI